MKTQFAGSVLVLSALLLSCDNDSPQPIRSKVTLPLRLELDDYTRELHFDAANRLSSVKTSSFYPGEVVLESTTDYYYQPGGKLEKAVTDNGYRLQYTWQDDRIVRTDQYIDNVFSQHFTFSYDIKGRLHEFTTWQDVPEEGGLVPTSKEMYLYDSNDNLTSQFLYYYDSGIKGHALLTSFEYSDYDSHVEAESLFDGYSFNPTAVFRKNNPGRMITKNASGNAVLIDQYTYVYNADGYASHKTTTSVFSYNGSGGSYDTHYYYQER